MHHTPEETHVDKLPAHSKGTLSGKHKASKSQVNTPSKRVIRPEKLVLKTADGKVFYPSKHPLEMRRVWLTKDRVIEVYYKLSTYIKSPDDINRIANRVGLKQFDKAVRKQEYTLDDALVETMFEKIELIYFISKDGKLLFATSYEMDQQKYGPLQPIRIMDALRKYGVSALDESIERGVATING